MSIKREKFIGVKEVYASKMNRQDYNTYRGWKLPDDEDGSDEGYLVEYLDGGKANHPAHKGYISWSPKDVFERAYHPTVGMSFGFAIEAAKKGSKIARIGWNGQNMFVVYQKGYPQGIACNAQTAIAWGMKEGDLFKCEPYLQIQMVNGSHSMWVPSINDILSNDWFIKS